MLKKGQTSQPDLFELEIKNTKAAVKALKDAGFENDGYTMIGNKIHLLDFSKGGEDFRKKLSIITDKFEQYEGQIKSKRKFPTRSEYLDNERRGKIIERIGRAGVRQQQSGAGFRDAIQVTKSRNEAYSKWKEAVSEYDPAKDKNVPTKDLSVNRITSIRRNRDICLIAPGFSPAFK